MIRSFNFSTEFRYVYFQVKFPAFKKHCEGQGKHICRLNLASGPNLQLLSCTDWNWILALTPWVSLGETLSLSLFSFISEMQAMHLIDTCLTGRCEVQEVQKHLAQHLVLGRSLLLLLNTLCTPAYPWFSCSACGWLATTTGTQGSCLSCYSWWPESCFLWALSILCLFPFEWFPAQREPKGLVDGPSFQDCPLHHHKH